MHARKNLLVAVFLLAVFVAYDAWAACNSLPTVSEVTAKGTQAIPLVVTNSGSGSPAFDPELLALRYKGTVGRTDGVHFVAGPMRFVADGICVRRGEKAPDDPRIRTMGDVEDVIVFVIFDSPPGHPVPVWAYSAAEEPSTRLAFSLETLRKELDHALDKPGVARLLPTRWDDRADPLPLPHGVVGLSVARPRLAIGSAEPTFAGLSLASSAVRVVAMHAGKRSAERVAQTLAYFVQHKCEMAACGRFAEDNITLCIDKIYSRVSIAQGVKIYVEDPFLCTVEIPAPGGVEIDYNDFAGQCEILPGSMAPPDLASCSNVPSTIRFWRSECGAIHFPLDYTTIRRKRLPDGTTTEIDRMLTGRSGVGRGKNVDRRRIFIPGREFLGSTPPHDPSASLPGTKWRLPDVEPWYPAGPESAELGLRGTVDKNRSIVHIFPRRPAFRTCPAASGLEGACMGINQSGIFCANDGSAIPPPTCNVTSDEGKYFACKGGGRDDMPCTRDLHCRRKNTTEPQDGSCTRKPLCRTKGTVWRYKKNAPYPGPGTPCWTDTDCGPDEQCGYSLFDFADRVDADGLHTLDTTIVAATAPTSRERRGACVQDETTECTNDGTGAGPPLCASNDRCRGYVLTAEGEAP